MHSMTTKAFGVQFQRLVVLNERRTSVNSPLVGMKRSVGPKYLSGGMAVAGTMNRRATMQRKMALSRFIVPAPSQRESHKHGNEGEFGQEIGVAPVVWNYRLGAGGKNGYA